jgi:hypothetical protein
VLSTDRRWTVGESVEARVNLWMSVIGGCSVLCARQSRIKSVHKPATLLKWEIQIRHNLYFSLILSGGGGDVLNIYV